MTSTKNGQFCDLPTNLICKKEQQIWKHLTNFKTFSHPFRVDVMNTWSLAPPAFEANSLTYLSVDLRFQEGKIKNVEHLKISADLANSFCMTNPRNWQKIEKTLFCKISKIEPGHIVTRNITTEVMWYKNWFLLLLLLLFIHLFIVEKKRFT